MKIQVVLLLMLACGTYADLIQIQEGEAVRPLGNFSCSNGTIETHGIMGNYFSVRKSGKTTSVFLKKKIDLKNSDDFPVISGSDCLKQVNLSDISIDFKCNDVILKTSVIVISPKPNPTVNICNTSCKEIKSPLALKIPENTTVNSEVKRFDLCSDGMNVQTSSISVSATGVLGEQNKKSFILKEKLDYENKTTKLYSNISINERHVLDIDITIEDSDDLGIVFQKIFYHCRVPENEKGRMPNCSVTATDMDAGINAKVKYKLVSVSPSATGRFQVQDDGSLELLSSLDRESISIYYLFIKGYQEDRPDDRVNYTTLQLTVTDVNDNPPVILLGQCNNTSIMENSPIGTLICQVSATDKDEANDRDPTDHLLFTLKDDNGGKFGLQENKFLKTQKTLDRESKGNYSLTISVNDSVHVTYATVDITVIDVNDNSPIFEKVQYKFNVTEEQDNVTVGDVKATDLDTGENGKFDCHIDQNSPWNRNFTVKTSNGLCQIKTKGKIDREKLENGNSLQFFVFATDRGTPRRTNSSSILIIVEDINDHIPQFVNGLPNTFTVKENASISANSHVFQVSAVDQDSGENGKVEYIIRQGINNASELFSIHSTSGVISLKKSLTTVPCNDRKIIFEVDAYNPISRESKDTINITCIIEDVNNHQPLFVTSFNKTTIRETNQLLTHDIHLCFESGSTSYGSTKCKSPTAKDEDCLESNSKLFYWMDNNDNRFKINSSTGIIIIKSGSSLDYDSPHLENVIKFTVYATDALYTATRTLTLSITNSHDSFPEFSKDTYLCSVDECPSTNLNCSLVLRNENDTLPANFFIYTLPSKETSTHFHVNKNGKTAEINMTRCYDFESISNDTINLRVEAQALRGNTTTSCNVKITIRNVNDNPPKFGNTTYQFGIFENYKKGYILGRINASDADNLGSLTYTLESNEYLRYSNGNLQLSKEPDLDDGALKSPLKVRIFAFDGKHNGSASIVVEVKHVNEFPPEFKPAVYNITVNENEAKNISLKAHDNDTGLGGNITRYISHIPEKWNRNVSLKSNAVEIHGFDREAMGSSNLIQFTVEAIDGGTPPRTGIAIVRILVEGVDDNIPKFSEEEKRRTVYVHAGATHGEIFTSKASDADIGTGSQVLYSFDKNYDGFQLAQASGILKCTKKLYITDTNNGYFNITIKAYNKGKEKSFDLQNITIILQDINNNIPKFSSEPYQRNVSECTVPSTMLIWVNASDADTTVEFNTVTYWIENTYNSTFYIDPKSGKTYLGKSVDFDPPENQHSFNLAVYATDDLEKRNTNSNHTSKATVSILITGCNDNFPVFDQDRYKCKIQENKKGSFNCTVKARDVDVDNLTYSLVGNDNNQNISVASTSGVISVTSPFDFDTMKSKEIVLNVSASDGKHKSYAQVVVQVTDENDIRPVFLGAPYNFSVPENTESYIIGAVDVNDTDSKSVTLALVNCTDILEVTGNGNIVARKQVDYEDKQKYECSIAANDTTSDSVCATITINVIDKNDNVPVFGSGLYKKSVNETLIKGKPVCQVSADDKDTSKAFNQISYAIFSGNSDELLVINNATGEIRTAKDLINHGGETLDVVIKAADNGKPPLTGYTNVSIEIKSSNIHPPEFPYTPYKATILENRSNGTELELPPIIVKDRDNGSYGQAGLVYMLNDTNAPFCIKRNKPSVYVCGNIDREQKSIYYLGIIANDSNGTAGSLSASAPLIIHILDVNDETPRFQKNLYQYSIPENANISETVGNVSATDEDERGYIRYNIVAGDDGRFYINPFTGMIYIGGIVDRESMSKYSLNISASDGLHKTFTRVDISINDTNDNPPNFFMATFQEAVIVEVEENSKAGEIFNATATDLDDPESVNSKVTYSLVVHPIGDESDLFGITADGGLHLSKPLDRETKEYYELNITATDQGDPPLSTSLLVHVKVLDVNDNRPEICVDGQCNINMSNCYTVEKVPKNSVLKLIGSKDLDDGQNATVSYAIESSDVSKYFKIDNNTGVVAVEEPLVVNNLIHEGLSESNGTVVVNLTVVATDGGGLNTTLTLHVFVEPLNDDDVPVFSESAFKFNISETNSTDVPVGDCSATTNDANSHMTYEIIHGYEDYLAAFKIDQSTGELRTIAPLDRETVDRYTFAVQVRDGRVPERTAFATVEITVDDVNDNSPTFMNNNMTISVHENAMISIQKNVSAHDNDAGLNAEMTYTLNVTNDDVTQESDGSFNISDGILTVTGSFDYEQKKTYDIVVTATDKGNNSRSGTAEVHIIVVDENDNSPKFVNIKQFYNVSEDKTSKEIFTANATDDDSGWNGKIVYKLLNTDDVPFIIDTFNGTVCLQGNLDYETSDTYLLRIVAQDLGTPPKSTTSNVTIYVEDVYDDILLFPKDIYDINVSRATKVNTSLLNLTVAASQAYFALKGQEAPYFRIGKESGELFLVKSLNDERELYVIQVIAEDGHGQNASCTVFVHVKGHQVTFNVTEIKLKLMENRNGTSFLVDLNTTAEFSENDVLYTIEEVRPSVPDKDLFKVDNSSGVVTCTKSLDREEHAQYTILIAARKSDSRRKREIQRSSSTITLVVSVGDINDNPPHFSSDQEKIFGVPDDVRANYIVGTIKAEDPDISDIGHLRYKAEGGRTDIFGVDEVTGDIVTLVAIASTRQRQFNLLINASDGNSMNEKATLNVTIYVVPTKNQPILLVNMTVAEFKKREDGFRRNMSDILGVRIQFEKIESHQIVDQDGRTHVDLSRTDLIFHGINKTSGMLVPNGKMQELINKATEDLSRLFGQKVVVNVAIVDVTADPSAITATQIIFICMAVFIFFGSLTALIVAQYSWMRYETERKEDEKEADRIEQEMELSTIRSRQSSKLSSVMTATAINPGYVETEFITSNGRLSPETKAEVQYESQELRVNLQEEPFETYLNDPNPGETAQGAIDNTSVHSEGTGGEANGNCKDNLQVNDGIPVNGEGPIITSSPRVYRDVQPVGELFLNPTPDEIDSNYDANSIDMSQGKRSRGSSMLLVDATGDSETDDTIDGDAIDVGKGHDENKMDSIVSERNGVNVGKVSENPDEMSSTQAERDDDGLNGGDGSVAAADESKDGENELENKEDTDLECTSF